MVEDGAYAAELLAAARAAGAAVHQHRQGGAVAGRLAGVVAVEDQDPAVPRRQAQHHGAGDVGVVGDQGRHQAAAAAGRELDGLVEAVVGEHRAHRPERLDVVRLDRAAVGAQQHGGEERSTLGVAVDHVDVVGVAVDQVGGGAQ